MSVAPRSHKAHRVREVGDDAEHRGGAEDDEVFVEIKATDIKPIHEAQLRTYLRLAKRPLGLVRNFNSVALKQGIRRLANDFPG
jgi:hypothetical protein